MKMLTYQSSRGMEKGISASEAIVRGIAKDNGLFVPSEFPRLSKSLVEYQDWNYQKLAKEILSLYLPDFTAEELDYCVHQAYGRQFDTPKIAPVVKYGKYYFLELFHGPTYAFKDMALQILPLLMQTAAKKMGMKKKILILTATSGDTGKAAMEGFADVENTKIVVFYPKNGVSFIQEHQMCTQKGENVKVVGIRGNFDDAQTGVKKLFQDADFLEQLNLAGYLPSSANSINIGRLVPQIVYYFYAYLNLLKEGVLVDGELLDVVVPSGNFGNILAAYYAKKMGLPLGVLVAASNENKVLADFFHTNCYDKNREMILTPSPSMDILVSSNLERLLYDISDAEQVKDWMEQLHHTGSYQISEEFAEKLQGFVGEYATVEECNQAISNLYRREGFLIDTHTAVAMAVADKADLTGKQCLIASTASPFKFSAAVLAALGRTGREESFSLPEELSHLTGVSMPDGFLALRERMPRFRDVVEPNQMKRSVLDFIQKG